MNKPMPKTLCSLRLHRMSFPSFPWLTLHIFLLLPLLALSQTAAQPKPEELPTSAPRSFLEGLMAELREVPVLGNVLRASVHPIYKPIVESISLSDEQEVGKSLCISGLGCIETPDDFFDPIYRPVNLPPYTREDINTVFTLHTPENKTGIIVPNDDVVFLVNATFSAARPTKIIIHGFLDAPSASWMVDMVSALLSMGTFNVFTVNWSGGSRALYSQAVANTRVVALEVALLITTLKHYANLQLADVHIIGHSLGAHTAGYVGERVPGLGRITGLDPAEPFFQHLPPMVRLDPSDAAFVDVIHTDSDSIFSLGYGLQQPVGHLDFYPNGGRNQPGCDTLYRVPLTAFKQGLDAANRELVACSHNRAPKLFVDAVINPCPYTAFTCPSYEEYEEGLCFDCGPNGKDCAMLGLNADRWPVQNRTHVQMFLSTTSGPPYCIYHHLVTVALADPAGTGGRLRGHLKLTFINLDGTLSEFDLTKKSPYSFPRGGISIFNVEHQHDLSMSTHVLITWTFEADMFNPLTFCVLFCSSDLPVASVLVENVDIGSNSWNHPSTVILCNTMGHDHIMVSSEQTITLSSISCHDSHWMQHKQASNSRNASADITKVHATQDQPSQFNLSSSEANVLHEQGKQGHIHNTLGGTPEVLQEKQFEHHYELHHQGQQKDESFLFSLGSSLLSLLPFQNQNDEGGFSSMWSYMRSFLPGQDQSKSQRNKENGSISLGSEQLSQLLDHNQNQEQEGQEYSSPFNILSIFQHPMISNQVQVKQQTTQKPSLYRRLLQAETRRRAQQMLERHRKQ
ncbi:pancreatic lipase-related protein 2-like isoform X2 [Oratosquilla oratoria]|uniref:pancreatic lipase-related protein 2-like isoform X2 n=1 Tax=Oratosquilla oratoria TaxID=337810 RepID=UPI003F76BA75